MTTNPYAARAAYSFWRRTMSGRPADAVDPVVSVPFKIGDKDRVATAGSCFAQHIARTLVRRGFSYLVTEKAPPDDDGRGNYGVFPARFGNIYTARQLLQLFNRAYGVFETHDAAWRRADGRYIDPFRPKIDDAGFDSPRAVEAEMEIHLAAVRRMFETCEVFIFTLGLTEAWESRIDGAVFPLAPGVVASDPDPADYAFHNFTVGEIEADMLAFIDKLRRVNAKVRIILTVSPVALMATYEDQHVLVSTTYSKAVLRVVAGTVSKARQNVAYFPSYEIVTGPQGGRAMYEDDLREVRPATVEHVMSIFSKHYLGAAGGAPVSAPVSDTTNGSATVADPSGGRPAQKPAPGPAPRRPAVARASVDQEFLEAQNVICEEEALDPLP